MTKKKRESISSLLTDRVSSNISSSSISSSSSFPSGNSANSSSSGHQASDHQRTYPVRMDLKQTLPGPYFQLLGALSIMLEELIQSRKFDLRLEVAELGALDDVVVDYYDDTRTNIIETRYLQFKHSNDNTETLKVGDLINRSGKLEIFKYFDDWYLFVVQKNGHMDCHKCIYYTNRELDSELTNNVFTFSHSENAWQFSEKFYSTELFTKLFSIVKQNSVLINRKLVEDASSQKIAKDPTYKEAKNYYKKGKNALSHEFASPSFEYFLKNCYQIQANQPHVEILEEQVQKQIKGYFSDIADTSAMLHALVFEAWQWFREIRDVEIWTEEIIAKKLEESKLRYVNLPEYVGKFLGKLQCQTITNHAPIDRTALLEGIKSIIQQPENKQIVFYGDPGIGKTWLIAKYLLNSSSLKQGSYYYFSSPKEFNTIYPDLKKFDHIDIFIVDGIEKQEEILIEYHDDILSRSKKIVLISLVCLDHCSIQLFIPELSDVEISAY